MAKNEVTVVGGAPYAVCLTDGRELSPGQVTKVELDAVTESQIVTGTLNLVEPAEPVKETPARKASASPTTTEGETE